MLILYQTRDMESAAIVLAQTYKHVLVRATCGELNPPIRFRAKLLDGVPVYYARRKGYEYQIERFIDDGGILIWQRLQRGAVPPQHDAQVVCEVPTTINRMHLQLEKCSGVAVLYRPPTWETHKKYVMQKNILNVNKALNDLREVTILVERLPEFNQTSQSRSAQSQTSQPARESPESSAPTCDSPRSTDAE